MVEMKTITYNGVTYEIVDEKARTKVNELNEEIVDLKAQLDDEPQNLIVSYTDGKYITDDGMVASYNGLTLVEAHGLVPNKKLRCTLWADPNTTINTASGWKADGTYAMTNSTNKFNWTALGGDVYECIIPNKVVTLKFNIYTTQKETAVCFMPTEEEYKYIPSYITHIVAKPLGFANGKKLVAFGDSITMGVQSYIDTSGNTQLTNDYTNQYIKLFCDKLGLTLTNKALSGTTIANVSHPTETSLTADKSIYNQVITTDLSSYDFILIAGGCNDGALQTNIGALGSADNTTTYGALETMCQYIQSNKKTTAQVIFLTPIPLLKNLANPLENYRNAVFEVAVKYGFNVIDGYKMGFPYEESAFSKVVFPDGCHPSIVGHKMYANSLLGVLVGEIGGTTESTEPSEPKNLIVGYTDGKYITSDGGVATLDSVTMVEADGLIPGRKLHCTLWIDPNSYGNTAVGYTANGTYAVGSSGFSWTSLGNDVYECVIPTNVEKLKFNIYTTQKETAVCYMPNE